MPDVTSSTYNSNNELLDRVGSTLPPIFPDPALTPNQSTPSDSFFQGMQALVGEQNPWLKTNFLNTPLNVKLSETERYQDPEFGYNPYNPNIEYQYGDRQGALEKWKNNLIKFGGNVIGSFTEGMATIPLVFNAIKNGTLSDIENNTLVNGISDWQLKLENDNPNYETTYGKEHPFLNYIPFVGNSGDAWGGVLKNLGYTTGAIMSSLVQDAAIGSVTEGIGAAPLIGIQLTKAANYLGKIFNSGENVYKGYREAKIAGLDIVKAIERSASNAQIITKARYGLALLTSSTAEAMVEANQSMRDVSDELKREFYDTHGYEAQGDDLEQIKTSSLSSGNATLLANIALLTLTNSIQFGSILKPTKAAKASLDAAIDDGLKLGLKEGSLDIIEAIPDVKSGLKGILRKQFSSAGAKSFVTEGFEEGSQFVVQEASNKYYTRKYDQASINEVDNFAQSLGEGLHDVFTTREGIENILIGGLSGAIIHPMRSLGERALGIRSDKAARLANTITLLNENPITGLFNDKFNAAVNSFNINTNASAKLKGGDLYGYRNEKFLQLFNFVDAGIKTNRFEAQIDRLKTIKNLPFNEQAALLNIKDADTTKEQLDAYVDSTIQKAMSIKSDIEKVNNAFTNKYNRKKNQTTYDTFEHYKTEIAVSISQLRDNKKRIVSVGDEVRSTLPMANIDKVVNLTTDNGLNQTIKDFKKRISELDKDDSLFTDPTKKAEIRKERKFLEDSISDIEKLVNRPSNFDKQENENNVVTNQDVKDLQLPLVQTIMDYYSNGMDETKDQIDQIDAISTFNKAQDIAKLYGDVTDLKNYYNKLLDKKGFEAFAKLEDAAIKKRAAENPIIPDNVDVPDDQVYPEVEDLNTPNATAKDQNVSNEQRTPQEAATQAAEEEKPFDSDAIDAELEANKNKKKPTKKETEATLARLKREAAKASAGDDLLNAQEDKKDLERKIAQEKKEASQEWSALVSSNQPKFNLDERHQEIEDKYKQQIAELEAKIAELTKVKEKADKEATPKEVKLTTGNKKYTLNPLNYFFRVFIGDFRDAQEERKTAIDVIFNSSKKDIYDGITLSIVPTTKGNIKFGQYRPLTKSKVEGSKFENVYQTGYENNISIMFNGKNLGLIQPSNRLAFKRGEEFLPLSQLTKEEYVKVTENTLATYEDFMADLKTYEELFNKISNDFKSGKTTFTNAEIKKLFNIGISYGNVDYSYSPNTSTNLSDVTYDRPGNVVISLPMEKNEKGEMVRSSTPTIIGKEKLDAATNTKLLTFIANNIDKLKNFGRRYLFIVQLPNGEYDSTSVITARPNSLDEATKKDLNKLLTTVPKKEDVEEVNARLNDEFYIADAGNQVQGTNMSFTFTKEGKLYFNINNKNHSYLKNGEIVKGFNKRLQILNPEKHGSLNEFIIALNNQIKWTTKADKGLETLNINLTLNSLKNGIMSDENVTFAEVKDKLSLAVRPGKDGKTSNIFENPGLVIIPLNGRKPAAPKTDPVKKETTPVVTPAAKPAPVVTPTETKTSTKMAESFIKDKEAKEKARNEAKNQTTQEVEDDFLNSIGCK